MGPVWVWNEFKIWIHKSDCVWLNIFAEGFNKICDQFQSFCMNGKEQSEAEKHFVFKNVPFSVLKLQTTHFEWILNKNLETLKHY